MIVVLDTNVWVSGFQFASQYGAPTRAIEKAMNQDVIATCSAMEEELFRVLTIKFCWEPERVHRALRTVLARAIHIELQGTVQGCRDPNDDMFLECAVRAHADFLIAGDKDLLVLGEFKGTRILTPAAYVHTNPVESS